MSIATDSQDRNPQPYSIVNKSVVPAGNIPPRISVAYQAIDWINGLEKMSKIGPSGDVVEVGRDLTSHEQALRKTFWNAIVQYVTGEQDFQNYIMLGDQGIKIPVVQQEPSPIPDTSTVSIGMLAPLTGNEPELDDDEDDGPPQSAMGPLNP